MLSDQLIRVILDDREREIQAALRRRSLIDGRGTPNRPREGRRVEAVRR